MFKCVITGRDSRPGEKLNKIVIKTRNVQYKHVDFETEEEWVTEGTEIVKEVNACDEGMKLWNSLLPEAQQELLINLGLA